MCISVPMSYKFKRSSISEQKSIILKLFCFIKACFTITHHCFLSISIVFPVCDLPCFYAINYWVQAPPRNVSCTSTRLYSHNAFYVVLPLSNLIAWLNHPIRRSLQKAVIFCWLYTSNISPFVSLFHMHPILIRTHIYISFGTFSSPVPLPFCIPQVQCPDPTFKHNCWSGFLRLSCDIYESN